MRHQTPDTLRKIIEFWWEIPSKPWQWLPDSSNRPQRTTEWPSILLRWAGGFTFGSLVRNRHVSRPSATDSETWHEPLKVIANFWVVIYGLLIGYGLYGLLIGYIGYTTWLSICNCSDLHKAIISSHMGFRNPWGYVSFLLWPPQAIPSNAFHIFHIYLVLVVQSGKTNPNGPMTHLLSGELEASRQIHLCLNAGPPILVVGWLHSASWQLKDGVQIENMTNNGWTRSSDS